MGSWRAYVLLPVLFGLYPLAALVWLLGTWVVASLLLGHTPVPFADNPNDIDGAMFTVLYFGCQTMIVLALPMLGANALVACVSMWAAAREKEILFHRVVLPAAVGAVTWSAGYVFLLEWDPLNLTAWLFD